MFRRTLMAIAIATLAAQSWAAVTADEAKQLGTTLTAVGAEKAGNADKAREYQAKLETLTQASS